MFSSLHRLVSRQSCLLCSYHVHLTIALAGPAEEVVQATPRLPHDHVSYHVRSRLVGSSVSHMLSYAYTYTIICQGSGLRRRVYRKRQKKCVFLIAKPYGPGLKNRLR